MTGWRLVRSRARLSDTAVAAGAMALALLSLVPLFEDLAWLPKALVMVGLVAVAGAASRAIAMPLPLVPVVEGFTVLAGVTLMFAGDSAWGRVVPTTESWAAIRSLLTLGMADAQAFAAPVPTTTQLILLAAGGAGLAALSVDTLFVSVRSPLLAGLPLAVLYLGSAILLFGPAPWWQFAPAAAGWLLLLAADQRERVREWGGMKPMTRVRGLTSLTWRVGAVAVALAVLAALVLPVRTLSPLLGGSGTGNGDTVVEAGPVLLDPLVSLRRSLLLTADTEILRYRTTNPKPPYLRVAALEAFDGVTWQPRPALAQGRVEGMPLPGDVLSRLSVALPEYHVRGGASYSYLISVTNLQNAYLPMPYPIADVADVAGLGDNWRLEPETGVAFSEETPATGLKYGVTALDPQVRPAELRTAAPRTGRLSPMLTVPSSVSPKVSILAAQVTADAVTPYDKAVALQKWFTTDGGFTYSTSVRSGADADYLTEFLTDRVGYCEQYAAAMALMARTLGIPARVVVGFTQGAQDSGGTWVVTARDAHAWPELWFDGYGWMRFEPTPRADAHLQAPDYAPYSNAGPTVNDGARVRDPGRFSQDFILPDQDPGLNRALILLPVALLLIAVALTPWAIRLIRRRRRLRGTYADVVAGAWAEVADTAEDFRAPWSPYATPRQATQRLSAGISASGTAALRRLLSQIEQARYGRRGWDGVDAAAQSERSAAVRADVRAVRKAIAEQASWRRRVVGYCWPPSARRRQRSSSRSMNPGAFGAGAAAGLVAADSSAARAPKAE